MNTFGNLGYSDIDSLALAVMDPESRRLISEAIARSRDMAMATRNVRDFEGMDSKVVDPWTVA